MFFFKAMYLAKPAVNSKTVITCISCNLKNTSAKTRYIIQQSRPYKMVYLRILYIGKAENQDEDEIPFFIFLHVRHCSL